MEPVRKACEAVFAEPATHLTPLHGGDLSEVARVTLADGRIVVAKQGAMVAREGRMLASIAAAGCPAPQVLGQSGNVLFLEALDETRAGPTHWARFGEDLARLHATTGPGYGWSEDYAFGAVMVYNATAGGWPDFWAERRLLPFVSELPRQIGARVETLARRLPEMLPGAPAPGLLHGDLWTGNLLATREAIHLIDPACYYGDGEVDLAMLHLFGGPGPGFREGYGGLETGWEVRRAVYSLFPALVHVRLFGAGYFAMADRFLTAARA